MSRPYFSYLQLTNSSWMGIHKYCTLEYPPSTAFNGWFGMKWKRWTGHLFLSLRWLASELIARHSLLWGACGCIAHMGTLPILVVQLLPIRVETIFGCFICLMQKQILVCNWKVNLSVLNLKKNIYIKNIAYVSHKCLNKSSRY